MNQKVQKEYGEKVHKSKRKNSGPELNIINFIIMINHQSK